MSPGGSRRPEPARPAEAPRPGRSGSLVVLAPEFVPLSAEDERGATEALALLLARRLQAEGGTPACQDDEAAS